MACRVQCRIKSRAHSLAAGCSGVCVCSAVWPHTAFRLCTNADYGVAAAAPLLRGSWHC